MPRRRPSEGRGWDSDWAGHELAQLKRLARLPLREKLAWLERAQALAVSLRRKKSVK